MAPVTVWRWVMGPWVMSRRMAAWTRLVWAPFRSRSCCVRPQRPAYFARAFSSSRETSPSSRADWTAACQALTRSPLAWPASIPACRMVRARSWMLSFSLQKGWVSMADFRKPERCVGSFPFIGSPAIWYHLCGLGGLSERPKNRTCVRAPSPKFTFYAKSGLSCRWPCSRVWCRSSAGSRASVLRKASSVWAGLLLCLLFAILPA